MKSSARRTGVLVGFASEDDWFDYRLENDPRFLERIEKARAGLAAGRGVAWEEVAEAGACEFMASDKPRGRKSKKTGR